MNKQKHVYRASAELFPSHDVERSIEKEEFMICYPTGNYEGENTPIEFNLLSDNLHYINLYDSELRLNVKLTKKDGSAVPTEAVVGCVNNLLDSLFSNVECFINGQAVDNISAYHPYKSYIRRVMSLGEKDNVAYTSGMFNRDRKPNDMTYDGNPEFKSRADLIKQETGVNLIGRIQHSLFDQESLLPNHVSIKIVLRKSSPDFVLLGSVVASDYKLKISAAELHYKRVILDDQLVSYHQKLFNSNHNAEFNIVKREIKTVPIAANSVTALSDSLYNGLLPNKIIIAFAKSTAFNGEIGENPFRLNNFGLSQINLKIDKESFSYRNIDVDFSKNFEHVYHSFLKTVCPHDDTVITKEEFKDSYCFYIFSLYPSKIRGYKQLQKLGNIRLEVKFSSANTFPLTAILYSETECELQIDKYGNINFP